MHVIGGILSWDSQVECDSRVSFCFWLLSTSPHSAGWRTPRRGKSVAKLQALKVRGQNQ